MDVCPSLEKILRTPMCIMHFCCRTPVQRHMMRPCKVKYVSTLSDPICLAADSFITAKWLAHRWSVFFLSVRRKEVEAKKINATQPLTHPSKSTPPYLLACRGKTMRTTRPRKLPGPRHEHHVGMPGRQDAAGVARRRNGGREVQNEQLGTSQVMWSRRCHL